MKIDFSNVLFIGPQNAFGGIGAVLRTYQENMKTFNFIATHKDQSKFLNLVHFIFSIFRITFFLLVKKRIKIVHIHSASKGSFIRKLLIAMLVKVLQKKVIFHMHGGQFKEYFKSLTWSRPMYIFLLNRVDLFICLTDEWKTYFQNTFGIKQIKVIGNPVNIKSSYDSKSFTNEVSLLFLGTLNSKKGIFNLLDYIHSNHFFKNKQIKLVIAGTGEVDKLKHIISDYKYLNQIEYIGFVNGDAKFSAIDACDIFILPSYYEGLPVSILEALGYGKPVIATKVGGVQSIVKDKVNGWLFDAGEFSQLDQILDEIMNQKFPLKEYQINAYNIAKTFSSQNILADLSKMYNKVLN